MKIAIFEADKECAKVFSTLPADIFPTDIDHALKEPKEHEAISIFIRSRITQEVLERLPKLRYIQTRSTGYDHIDIDACKKRGIIVSNVQGYARYAVAEFAFSLMLNISRKTHQAIQRAKSGDFAYKDLLGFELFDKTIAIIGLGNIGKQVATIAKGFGMHVRAYTRHFDEEFCAALEIEKCKYPEVLENADFILFAVPLTPDTYHMLDRDSAKRIKKDASIINIARGEIIAQEVLEYLSDSINALGLDVIENEKELLRTKPRHFLSFIQKPNILYTPHMAYYTKEALGRIRTISLRNMKNFLEGKEIDFVIG